MPKFSAGTLGLALASGIRLYATVLTLGLGIRFGWLSGLPPELSAFGLNSQGNGPAYWAIGGIGFLVTVLLILAGVGYTAIELSGRGALQRCGESRRVPRTSNGS